MPEKRKPGRPPGIMRPHKEFTYLSDAERRQLQKLRTKRGGASVAALLREGLLGLFSREDIQDDGAE